MLSLLPALKDVASTLGATGEVLSSFRIMRLLHESATQARRPRNCPTTRPVLYRLVPAAAGGMDEGVAVWDLPLGAELGSLDTDEKSVLAVSLARLTGDAITVAGVKLAGDPIVVAGVEDEILVWGLADEHGDDPVQDPLTGHEDVVVALDTAVIGDRVLAVSGGDDATVRLWDLATGTQLGEPLIGHGGSVETVRTAVLDGRLVALSAGRDSRINIWDLQAIAR
ncbi:hypothetical protein ACQPZP_42905 [Spirillospora sp. CA-142024]|uniref:hypothetical protein n=1 Tax=Spirillospora sp. CA-142024 TaxID=3240036 RepID=UPI003D91FCCC